MKFTSPKIQYAIENGSSYIRRQAWGKHCYICSVYNTDTQTLEFRTHTDQEFKLFAEAIIAKDWEVKDEI